MHRKPELLNKVSQWLELELETTCVPMGMYMSIEIKLEGKRLGFTKKHRGRNTDVGSLYLDDTKQVTGMVIASDVTAAITLMLFALEKAIETF